MQERGHQSSMTRPRSRMRSHARSLGNHHHCLILEKNLKRQLFGLHPGRLFGGKEDLDNISHTHRVARLAGNTVYRDMPPADQKGDARSGWQKTLHREKAVQALPRPLWSHHAANRPASVGGLAHESARSSARA